VRGGEQFFVVFSDVSGAHFLQFGERFTRFAPSALTRSACGLRVKEKRIFSKKREQVFWTREKEQNSFFFSFCFSPPSQASTMTSQGIPEDIKQQLASVKGEKEQKEKKIEELVEERKKLETKLLETTDKEQAARLEAAIKSVKEDVDRISSQLPALNEQIKFLLGECDFFSSLFLWRDYEIQFTSFVFHFSLLSHTKSEPSSSHTAIPIYSTTSSSHNESSPLIPRQVFELFCFSFSYPDSISFLSFLLHRAGMAAICGLSSSLFSGVGLASGASVFHSFSSCSLCSGF